MASTNACVKTASPSPLPAWLTPTSSPRPTVWLKPETKPSLAVGGSCAEYLTAWL